MNTNTISCVVHVELIFMLIIKWLIKTNIKYMQYIYIYTDGLKLTFSNSLNPWKNTDIHLHVSYIREYGSLSYVSFPTLFCMLFGF